MHFAVEETTKSNKEWRDPPTSEAIKDALAQPEPADAPEEMKQNMDFLLMVVFPAIDPRAGKREFSGVGVMEQFDDSLPQEMATAWLLLDHFSKLDNIKFNLGMTWEDGTEKATTEKPDRKKRKKTMTKSLERQLGDECLEHVRHCQVMVKETTFEHRMKEWDKLSCHDDDDDGGGVPPLENHVPQSYQTSMVTTPGKFEGSFGEMIGRLEQAGDVQAGESDSAAAADANAAAVANAMGASNVTAA